MNRTRFIFEVVSEVEFSWEEVDYLIELARQHYDHKVRRLAEYGGVLVGMKNSHVCGDPCRAQLSTRDLDTLCKAVESPGAGLLIQGALRGLLDDAQEQYRRLNVAYLAEDLDPCAV